MESISLAILSAITESIFAYFLDAVSERPGIARLRQLLSSNLVKANFQLALARALAVFTGKYPDLASSFFDERFLTKPQVAEELAKVLDFRVSPDVDRLTLLWQEQFSHPPRTDLTEPLRFLLSALEKELKAFPEFRDIFNTKNLEALTNYAASTSANVAEVTKSLQQTNQRLREIAILLETNRITPHFKELFLAGANYQCSICHTTQVVNLYPLDPSGGSVKGYEGLIALCADCYLNARQQDLPPTHLGVTKMLWLSACKTGEPLTALNETVEQTFKEAVHLSLSQDLDDVRRAIIKCQGILYYNPFHTEAQLLLDRLMPLEKLIAKEKSEQELKLRSTASQVFSDLTRNLNHIGTLVFAIVSYGVLVGVFVYHTRNWQAGMISVLIFLAIAILRRRWVIYADYFFLLPAILIHETGHILGIYFTGGIKNAAGQRMPLWRYFKYIELEVDGKPLQGGIKEAIERFRRHRELSAIYVNWSKMQYEWYNQIQF